MSKRGFFIRKDIRVAIILAAAALMLALSAIQPASERDSAHAARKMERVLVHRLSLLDSYVDKPTAHLPPDMVIYRYSADTLHSWRNQFSVTNDNLNVRMMMPRLANPLVSITSPLTEVGEEWNYFNFGPRWYLARSRTVDKDRIIEGLEIVRDPESGASAVVNKHLRLNRRFSVMPLDYSGGVAVNIDGSPRLKIIADSLQGRQVADAPMVWASLLLLILAALVFVINRRSLKRALVSIAAVLLGSLAVYVWGRAGRAELPSFSPSLFAGGRVLNSLGAVVLVNLATLASSLMLYQARKDVALHVRTRKAMLGLLALDLLAVAGIIAFSWVSLSSIILDSSISLELYKPGTLSMFSVLVYVSFFTMLTSIPMLLQLLRPVFSRFFGWHPDFFSQLSRTLFAAIAAVAVAVLVGVLGFQKEENRVGVWANRLSVDRDINLELRLRRTEEAIANDVLISSLSMLNGTEAVIRNRIAENYLMGEVQDYSIEVLLIHPDGADMELSRQIVERLSSGEPVADGSRFVFVETPSGNPSYGGLFYYFNKDEGLTRMLLRIDRKTDVGERGYASLFDLSSPGRTHIPSNYSYARYKGREIRTTSGSYAYPTRLDDQLYSRIYEDQICHLMDAGYAHFITLTSDDEAVIVSRPSVSVPNYAVAILFMWLLGYIMMLPFGTSRANRRMKGESRDYYRTRISWVMMSSLVLTLVAMSVVSVVFVYRRNESNRQSIMSSRISSIQALVQDGLRGRLMNPDLRSQDVLTLIETVSSNTTSDITLFAPDGSLMMSTAPEVFDRMLLGSRMDATAFEAITGQTKRYYIQREHVGNRSFYGMYAPLIGPGGNIVAIICSPYTEESLDFERDALMHAVTILTVFAILLLFARALVSLILGMLFKPLSEMGRRMNNAGLDNMEQISYDRDDEISTLVKAYNRMVTELSESTRKLAQAERDKAWSGMARQVAHEIKNPLTPMKLQIQRIVRLKQKGDPTWADKFDEMSKVLLDHIDILTDTANEFSTFAKLYSEEPTSIDLDALLQDEVTMFDNRDNISFEYRGLAGASIMGPKPQLTRVFVNLINNAVQALESSTDGRIVVSLRNSVKDGYYDIVVEDNGSGVSEENVGKLFTPNFTTKSSGSGLGLAISRSILERCDATITYSRSFSLGGACFTVEYPK